MNGLEFAITSTTCDSCGRNTRAGFYHMHRETPVLFDCTLCVNRHASQEAIEAALEVHKAAAHNWMEWSQQAEVCSDSHDDSSDSYDPDLAGGFI